MQETGTAMSKRGVSITDCRGRGPSILESSSRVPRYRVGFRKLGLGLPLALSRIFGVDLRTTAHFSDSDSLWIWTSFRTTFTYGFYYVLLCNFKA